MAGDCCPETLGERLMLPASVADDNAFGVVETKNVKTHAGW